MTRTVSQVIREISPEGIIERCTKSGMSVVPVSLQ